MRCQKKGKATFSPPSTYKVTQLTAYLLTHEVVNEGGSVAEWLVCWTQVQKGPGSNRSRDAVG